MNWKLFLLAGGLAVRFLLPPALHAEPPYIPDENAVVRARVPIELPDLPGCVTLKCDFHIHTVFSDGLVWPSVRVEEAWRHGLDAIAITDHLEYRPYKTDVSTNHNRSYQIARDAGADLDILVIPGSEITRHMPPGHLNALFITNANALDVPEWTNAVKIARQQGAFILWNHPGWPAQLTDNQLRWYPEHTQLLADGLLHGIEISNGRDYYPQSYRWAQEKNLAVFGNSDIHQPVVMDYEMRNGDRRPVTLVFARERTVESIKEAMFARRTAVLWAGKLMGDEQFLRPLYEASVRVTTPSVKMAGRGRAFVQIHNHSSVDFILSRIESPEELNIPQRIVLPAQKTALLELRGRGAAQAGIRKMALSYRVRNLLVTADETLPVVIPVEVHFK